MIVETLFFKDPETLIDIYTDLVRQSQPSGSIPTVTFKNDWFEFRYGKNEPVQFRSRKADFVTMIEGIINNAKENLVETE